MIIEIKTIIGIIRVRIERERNDDWIEEIVEIIIEIEIYWDWEIEENGMDWEE